MLIWERIRQAWERISSLTFFRKLLAVFHTVNANRGSPNNRRPVLRESWAGPRTDSREGPATVSQYGAGQPLAVPVTVGCRAVLLAGSTDADLDHYPHRALLKLTSRQRIDSASLPLATRLDITPVGLNRFAVGQPNFSC
jgi:hypothetical protein